MISVPLGQLKEGNYTILVNPGHVDFKKSTISVESPGSQSIDNFSYANVNKVAKISENKIVLYGEHPSSCMEIDRVDVIPNPTQDTFSILPVVKQVAPICDRMIKPFSQEVDLPFPIKKSTIAHVRKNDGTASNFLLDD